MYRLGLLTILLLPTLLWAQEGTVYGLNNPVGFTSLVELFATILRVVMIFLTPIVVVFLILAGFKYVTARGNPEKISEANKALLYGVIGGVIIIGAVAILAMVGNLVGEFEQ